MSHKHNTVMKGGRGMIAIAVCVALCITFMIVSYASRSLASNSGVQFMPLSAVVTEAAIRSDELPFYINPVLLQSSGHEVTITWNPKEMRPNDTIEIFFSDFKGDEILAGYMDNLLAEYASQPTMKLALFNMRDYLWTFRYLSGGKHVIAMETVSFVNPSEPTQIHLALSSNPSDMVVSFTTGLAPTSADSLTRFGVEWSITSEALYSFAASEYSTYVPSDLCGPPAHAPGHFMRPGLLHHATMTNLPFSSTIYYRVGSDVTGWSAVNSFISRPAPGDLTPVTLFAFGDLGTAFPFKSPEEQQPPAVESVRCMVAAMPDFLGPAAVLNIGDISYARGEAKFWESFMSLIQPLAARAPYMVSLGNHEYDFPGQKWNPSWSHMGQDSGGECGVPVFARFRMPSEGALSVDHPWLSKDSAFHTEPSIAYSFDFGPVHVALFSSEHDYTAGSEQAAWLERDLASVDRAATPWVLVGSHRPMYSSSKGHSISEDRRDVQHEDDHLRAALEHVLVQHQVDLAMWGHIHVYERTCSLNNFRCAEKDDEGSGPVHVTMGSAGNVYNGPWSPYLPNSPFVEQADIPGYHHQNPPWSVFRTMNFGVTRIEASRDKLTLEFIGSQRCEVHDTLILHKPSMSA